MIDVLIDKQDNFEIIRDQIAGVLVGERDAQKVLAQAAGKDPALWDFKVFTERSNPIEDYLNFLGEPDDDTYRNPIINVWFDNSTFDGQASNIAERQTAETVFNIDCYGCGLSEDDAAGGHTPGDLKANQEAQRAFRLARNILMAQQYPYLGLRGLVGKRWPQSVTAFQPEFSGTPIQHVQAVRFALRVRYNEFSPQNLENTLELVSLDVKRAEDGLVYFEADYQYPL